MSIEGQARLYPVLYTHDTVTEGEGNTSHCVLYCIVFKQHTYSKKKKKHVCRYVAKLCVCQASDRTVAPFFIPSPSLCPPPRPLSSLFYSLVHGAAGLTSTHALPGPRVLPCLALPCLALCCAVLCCLFVVCICPSLSSVCFY